MNRAGFFVAFGTFHALNCTYLMSYFHVHIPFGAFATQKCAKTSKIIIHSHRYACIRLHSICNICTKFKSCMLFFCPCSRCHISPSFEYVSLVSRANLLLFLIACNASIFINTAIIWGIRCTAGTFSRTVTSKSDRKIGTIESETSSLSISARHEHWTYCICTAHITV